MCFLTLNLDVSDMRKRQDSSITFIQFCVNNLNKINLAFVLDILLLFYTSLTTSSFFNTLLCGCKSTP